MLIINKPVQQIEETPCEQELVLAHTTPSRYVSGPIERELIAAGIHTEHRRDENLHHCLYVAPADRVKANELIMQVAVKRTREEINHQSEPWGFSI